ncbi:MAG TPA: GNAT family N-acetyltransferase, partial [Miltoncostaea sp.]|nr:GNAT family N-acetyltransferase [Miltoncostaea sp.]
MAIRDADPARDAAACAAIYAPYVAGTATSFEEVPPGAEAMARRMAAYAAHHPWLVDEEEGRVVGYAYASAFAARAAYRWAAETAVYVDPGHHRRGVGR